MGNVDEQPTGRDGHAVSPRGVQLPRVPGRLLWALGIGVAAWFIAVTTGSTSSVNGVVVSCQILDWAKILLGALVIALSVDGARHARQRRRSLSWPVSAVLAAVLVVDGILLVLKGFDIILRTCG